MAGEFKAGSIKGDVTLDRGPAVDTLRAIPKEAATMKQGVERESKAAGESLKSGIGGAIEGLEKQIGRGSLLQKGFRLLAEGGAIGIAGNLL